MLIFSRSAGFQQRVVSSRPLALARLQRLNKSLIFLMIWQHSNQRNYCKMSWQRRSLPYIQHLHCPWESSIFVFESGTTDNVLEICTADKEKNIEP